MKESENRPLEESYEKRKWIIAFILLINFLALFISVDILSGRHSDHYLPKFVQVGLIIGTIACSILGVVVDDRIVYKKICVACTINIIFRSHIFIYYLGITLSKYYNQKDYYGYYGYNDNWSDLYLFLGQSLPIYILYRKRKGSKAEVVERSRDMRIWCKIVSILLSIGSILTLMLTFQFQGAHIFRSETIPTLGEAMKSENRTSNRYYQPYIMEMGEYTSPDIDDFEKNIVLWLLSIGGAIITLVGNMLPKTPWIYFVKFLKASLFMQYILALWLFACNVFLYTTPMQIFATFLSLYIFHTHHPLLHQYMFNHGTRTKYISILFISLTFLLGLLFHFLHQPFTFTYLLTLWDLSSFILIIYTMRSDLNKWMKYRPIIWADFWIRTGFFILIFFFRLAYTSRCLEFIVHWADYKEYTEEGKQLIDNHLYNNFASQLIMSAQLICFYVAALFAQRRFWEKKPVQGEEFVELNTLDPK